MYLLSYQHAHLDWSEKEVWQLSVLDDFFLKIVNFYVGNNILWDAQDCTRSHHFCQKISGVACPGPPSNSVCTQCYEATYTPAFFYLFR